MRIAQTAWYWWDTLAVVNTLLFVFCLLHSLHFLHTNPHSSYKTATSTGCKRTGTKVTFMFLLQKLSVLLLPSKRRDQAHSRKLKDERSRWLEANMKTITLANWMPMLLESGPGKKQKAFACTGLARFKERTRRDAEDADGWSRWLDASAARKWARSKAEDSHIAPSWHHASR